MTKVLKRVYCISAALFAPTLLSAAVNSNTPEVFEETPFHGPATILSCLLPIRLIEIQIHFAVHWPGELEQLRLTRAFGGAHAALFLAAVLFGLPATPDVSLLLLNSVCLAVFTYAAYAEKEWKRVAASLAFRGLSAALLLWVWFISLLPSIFFFSFSFSFC